MLLYFYPLPFIVTRIDLRIFYDFMQKIGKKDLQYCSKNFIKFIAAQTMLKQVVSNYQPIFDVFLKTRNSLGWSDFNFFTFQPLRLESR